MALRRIVLPVAILCWAGFGPRIPRANAQAPADSGAVIRTESRLVLVDTVVTDKKGEYIRDLAQKDFRVWEDNKEQSIKSFSFEADPSSPNSNQKHYLVLFFDNSTMQPGDQVQARQAAAKFIDTNTGPNKLIAIVNFGGSVHIAQNFTSDAERLKQVVSGVKTSAVNPNAVQVASVGMPSLGNAEADFGARSVMLALRSMAKSLGTVPGRKILVLLTAGFPLTEEVRSELTATIDACNRYNVAIYPIDVRGLVAGVAYAKPSAPDQTASTHFPSLRLLPASFNSYGSSFLPQHAGGGGGAGGGGSHGGGGTGGGTGGGGGGGKGGGTGGGTGGGGGKGGTGGGGGKGGTGGGGGKGGGGSTGGSRGGNAPAANQYINNPYTQSRQIIPPFPPSATTNQEIMYALAAGTGGFVIVNTNDLLGGLEKIGKEQNEYYILGYTPADAPEGSCHTIRVKVERGNTVIRSRSGYCDVKPVDLLAGNASEKELESRVNGTAQGNVTASMQVPFFYTGPNIARLNVAIEIPTSAVSFDKVKGKFHGTVNVLGVAYRPDGTVGAKFSDAVKVDLENKKEMEAFKEKPLLHYEDQFEVASGQYMLKVAFSSGGQSFGKLETPVTIDPYDGKQLALSGVALSRELHHTNQLDTGLDAELLEGHTPLVANGFQITPSGSSRFKQNETGALYLEVYEPALQGPKPPDIGLTLTVVDRKSGEKKQDTGMMRVPVEHPDNPMIPLGLKLPLNALTAGSYRVELKAEDTLGQKSATRSADFDVE